MSLLLDEVQQAGQVRVLAAAWISISKPTHREARMNSATVDRALPIDSSYFPPPLLFLLHLNVSSFIQLYSILFHHVD